MGVPPPIPPGASAADRRRVGSRSRSACPVGSCRSCARCCRFDKSTYHFDNSSCHFGTSRFHSSQLTGYYKQIKHLVVLVVCQLLDRFPVASRVPAALCSLFVRSLYDCIQGLEIIFHEIWFFRFGKIYDLYPVPEHVQHVKLWGGWVVVQLLPVRIPDTLPAAVGQLLGCRCILLAYTVGK